MKRCLIFNLTDCEVNMATHDVSMALMKTRVTKVCIQYLENQLCILIFTAIISFLIKFVISSSGDLILILLEMFLFTKIENIKLTGVSNNIITANIDTK